MLRLKSDYLAIATLGFAEILRAIFQWQKLGKITNGANMIKGFPTFTSFNITDGSGQVLFRLSTFVPFLVSSITSDLPLTISCLFSLKSVQAHPRGYLTATGWVSESAYFSISESSHLFFGESTIILGIEER